MPTVKDIYEYLNSLAPFETAAGWDNSGLLVGDITQKVTKAVIGLDITETEILLARKCGAELIISHHPVIFRAQKNFLSGNTAYEIASAGLSAVCTHTCLDKAVGGVNDALCEKLGMKYEKLPECTGEGYINAGTIEGINSCKELAEHISVRLGASVRYTDNGKVPGLIGVCSGAGGDLAVEAAGYGCNTFITGDASYHEFLDAEAAGVALFAAGHFETENMITEVLAEKLSARFGDIEFIISDRTSPIKTTV